MSIAIITGAASGIGLALTKVYLQRGIQVIMVDINQAQLMERAYALASQFPEQAIPKVCDITKPEAVDKLAQEVANLGHRIDWLYNNAGIIGSLEPIWALKNSDVEQVMQVNLYGIMNMTRAFMPILEKQASAHIINMASLYALCSGSHMAAYSMSKHAVLALSESLYFDLKRLQKPIDVSVVFPSFTDTALLASSEADSPFQHSLNTLLARSRPAIEIAEHILQEVEKKQFYILPDKEVKSYCEERIQALIMQEKPHTNSVEKIINSLLSRVK